jgi:hypothetical protein
LAGNAEDTGARRDREVEWFEALLADDAAGMGWVLHGLFAIGFCAVD